MELTHSFTVDRPVERTWAVLTDLDRVAACLPGAPGALVVRIGPVTARYEGEARIVERDDAGHRAVVHAEGRDVGGDDTAMATATIDLRLQRRGTGTLVTVDADLALAGRVARVGRGVVADVSGKLVREFAQRLEAEIAPAPPVQPAEPAAPVAATPVEDVEPLDLGSAGAAALAGVVRRHAVPVLATVLGLLVGWLLGRASHDIEKGN